MNILIVDDDPDVCRLLSYRLSKQDYAVSTASSGPEALALVENGSIPDLIILDVMMPEMDGFEVCRRLRQIYSLLDLPILMLTAKDRTEAVVTGLEMGANDYLSKTFSSPELLARVNTLLTLKNLKTDLQEENDKRKQAEDEVRMLNASLEQRVTDQTRELSALYEVSAVASRHLNLEDVLSQALERVFTAMQSRTGFIYLLEEDKTNQTPPLLNLVVHRGVPPDVLANIDPLPIDKGVGQRVIERSEPLLIPNLATTGLGNNQPDMLLTCLFAPMRAKGQALGILGVMREAEQSFKIDEISLLTSIADQMGVVVEGAQLRQLAERTAIFEDRQQLARDLHDSVTQLLYGVTILAEGGLAQIETDSGQPESLKHQFTRIGETARQAVKEMRLFIHQLRPSILEKEGLIAALHQRLDAVEGRASVQTRLRVNGDIELSPTLEEAFYHIAQEGLNNALRHSGAKNVTVGLNHTDKFVELTISDDGIGFDSQTVESGLGFETMCERAEKIGGKVEIVSKPNEGTTVKVTVPVEGN